MFRITFAALCCFLLLGAASCSKDKDYRKNPTKPKPHVVTWDVPRPHSPEYAAPLGVALTPGGKYLICKYWLADQTNGWGISIVDLTTENSKCFSVPWRVRVRGLSEETLAVFPYTPVDGGDCTGYFLDIDSLTRTGPVIPTGFPVPFESSSYIAVMTWNEPHRGDIWLFDTASKTELILPVSKHGLSGVTKRGVLANNRLLISGETAEDDDSSDSVKTQLWKLPQLEKICEYETSEWIPGRSSHYPQFLGKESFCFSPNPGLVKVASLNTGEVRFSLGRALTEAERQEHRDRDMGDPMWVVADPCCTQETGLVVCVESFKSDKSADIKTYDVNTGKCVGTLSVPFKNLEFVQPAKIGKEWVILCAYIDPEELEELESDDDPLRPHKMWLVSYRLRDMARAANSIEVWRGYLHDPMVVNGKLISVMTDRANIIDLSTLVNFPVP